jgi:hypothetical protein
MAAPTAVNRIRTDHFWAGSSQAEAEHSRSIAGAAGGKGREPLI